MVIRCTSALLALGACSSVNSVIYTHPCGCGLIDQLDSLLGRLLFIGEKHALHQVQPLLDQDYRPFLHMSSQTILCHHGWMPVKAKKLNINSRHKYVVFFQEVPGG